MKPTVPDALPFVHSVYRRHSAGCCWHVVLDDGNVADKFVVPTAERILSGAEWCGKEDCRKLAELLPQMSVTQRRKLGTMTTPQSSGETT